MKRQATKSADRFRVIPFPKPSGAVVFRVVGTRINGSRVRENFKTETEQTTAFNGIRMSVAAVRLGDRIRRTVSM
jgi:hypothetical protein